MTKHSYVYKSYEEEGREYIGCRTCDCLPEEDTKYFGSFKDKSFKPTEKTILFVCETREEVLEIEVELHDFFDVAVNPQFANQAKQTSTKFDTTGVSNAGEKHPLYGVPRTEAQKKAQSEKMSGRYLGALHPHSKAIIAIKPDGTELHFGSTTEVARELKIPRGSLFYYREIGHVLKRGKWKGWQFLFKNSEIFTGNTPMTDKSP